MKQELKVGDWVRDILTDEVAIVEENCRSNYYLLRATFQNGDRSFTKEGLDSSSHKNPRFIKVEPPKKKVKKTIEMWVNVHEFGVLNHLFCSQENADKASRNYRERIACVKLTGEYEVEE